MCVSSPAAGPVDLRMVPVDDVLDRVERALATRLDRATVVRRARSVGARTDRGTWVRVERRTADRIGGQGWNGTECAALLHGIAKPRWYAGVAWSERSAPVMWRADETSLLPSAPAGPSEPVTDPALPGSWWRALNASLDALAAQHTTRVATPNGKALTQEAVTAAIRAVFPGGLDTTVTRWAPAHADLKWSNVTAPRFCLFDWEDWGTAPRGFDSALLWSNSLLVPALADRVRRERREDLDSRDGALMTLFVCTRFLRPRAHPGNPQVEAARRAAADALDGLRGE